MTTTPAMPERFTKKPVTVEAVQFKNDGSSYALILWINEGQHAAGRRFASWRNNEIIVPTLEGEHIASVGDWIIKGVKGEFYPCKPDIFEMTYARAALSEAKAGGWQPIETAPRGSGIDGPDSVTHPDYVDPPKLLLWTEEGPLVGYYDWYYHPGYGRGAEDGESAWRDHSGARTYGASAWQPLPAPPAQRGEG